MLGLALIARDEEQTLPRLLASCEGVFDEVVLVDTGSVDATVARFEAWATRQEGVDARVAHFAWCDDFAAARQYAADQLRSQWQCWADCDDEIVGGAHLRALIAELPEDVAAARCAYDYATGHSLLRERVVRAGHGRWVGRVHEYQQVEGRQVDVDPDRVRWVHHADSGSEQALGRPRAVRDLELLGAMVAEDPYDRRAVFYLAQTHDDLGNREAALRWFERRADLGGWDEEVFWARYRIGALHADGGDWPAAMAALVSAWESRPSRLEPLYELCWRLRDRGEHHAALAFARAGLDVPVPADQLFVHHWVHEYGMLVEFSVAAYWAGDAHEALAATERLLAMDELPEAHRTHALANRAFCIERIGRDR